MLFVPGSVRDTTSKTKVERDGRRHPMSTSDQHTHSHTGVHPHTHTDAQRVSEKTDSVAFVANLTVHM